MKLLCIALLVFLAISLAAAHKGHLHDWPDTPTEQNFLRTKVGSCTQWVKPGKTAAAKSSAPAPTVAGTATVWQYLYKNCSGVLSSGIELDVVIKEGGKPSANKPFSGYAITGSCANPGSIYRFNMTLNETSDNMLFWREKVTASNGTIRGNAGNRGALATGAGGAKSILIYPSESKSAVACCDLQLAGPASKNWASELASKGWECDAKYNRLNSTSKAPASKGSKAPTPAPKKRARMFL